MDAKPEHSIWLVPAADHETMLADRVARLSAVTGAPAFAPHVTIQGDLALPLEELRGPLRRLAGSIAAQRWRVLQVETSAHFFRCLYLRFGAEPAFDALQANARHVTHTAQGLSPFAHLSLAYGHAGPDTARLCRALAGEFAGQEIVFDRLVIARSSSNVPLTDWQCLAHYALQAP